jgi:excisionase family DNA binding protein
MLNKNVDRDALAAVIAQAVASAIASFEPAKPAPTLPEEGPLSPLEFSRVTRFGLNRIRDFLNAKEIKSMRSGRRVLIPRSEVQAFLERQTEAKK